MKRFFVIVISLVILLIAGYGIAYFVSPLSSVELEEYGHEIGVSCEQAFIVRDETVYYATSEGTVYNAVSEGDRVSRDMIIGSIYNGDIEASKLRQMKNIDEGISSLRSSTLGISMQDADTATVENEISIRMAEVPSLAEKNDVEKLHKYKNDINSFRSGDTEGSSGELEALEAERTAFEDSLNIGKSDIVSDRSGIFSTYIDGMEGVFKKENIVSYDASYLRSLTVGGSHIETGSTVAVGDPVCKVMNNHIWYIFGIADAEHGAVLGSTERVTVKFTNPLDSDVKGIVEYVSEPDANGECVFLIQVPSYVESAFSYRTLGVDIVTEEYSGYKVPMEAIRTGDTVNEYYVYATKGSDTFKCDVDVLYTDSTDGFSIIRSKENAEVGLSKMERLVVGER